MALTGLAVGAYLYASPPPTASSAAENSQGGNRAGGKPVPASKDAPPAATRGGGRPPVPVVAEQARRIALPVNISAIGTAQAYSSVTIRAQIDGQIEKVHIKDGQTVRQGDLLITLDQRPFVALLRQAEANLARNRALLLKAAADLRRYEALARREYASQAQFEQARANADAIRATILADEALVEQAKLRLAYASIKAPIDGRVGTVLITAGNLVKANEGSILVLNQVKPIYAQFSVPEARLARIRARMTAGPVSVAVAIPEDTRPAARGTLTFINNAVDQTTGTIMLRATMPNDDERFVPGQYVSVDVELRRIENAIVVPERAIQIGQQDLKTFHFVFVVDRDRSVTLRRVTPGVTSGGLTEIRKGVADGETVVTVGQLRLRPGMRVRLDRQARALRRVRGK